MKTIRIKIYKFEELSKEAQNVAIEKFRNSGIDTDYIYDDAYKTVKAFNDVFGTKEGRNSWLDCSTNSIDENVLELKGFRLQKYLYNNFFNNLFKGKYYSLWGKKDKSFEYHKEGYPVLKSRKSKVLKDNSCTLTGLYCDEIILQPIYEFLVKRDFLNCNTTFYHLLNDCFENLEKSIEEQIDFLQTDEAIVDTILSNDYDFLKDGTQY